MLQPAFTFIWAIVNLLVLFFILKRLLFKPVTAVLEKRSQHIRESLDNAEKNKAEAAGLKQEYDLQIKGAKQEAESILIEARGRGGREYEALLSQARKDAEGVLAKAREEIDRERTQMLKDIRNQVVVLALSAASKVVEANMDTERNRVLVDQFINEEGAN